VGLSLPYLKASRDLNPAQVCAVIDRDRCINCLSCVGLGHCDAIVEKNGEPFVKEDECVGCAICVGVCPQGAISMERK